MADERHRAEGPRRGQETGGNGVDVEQQEDGAEGHARQRGIEQEHTHGVSIAGRADAVGEGPDGRKLRQADQDNNERIVGDPGHVARDQHGDGEGNEQADGHDAVGLGEKLLPALGDLVGSEAGGIIRIEVHGCLVLSFFFDCSISNGCEQGIQKL